MAVAFNWPLLVAAVVVLLCASCCTPARGEGGDHAADYPSSLGEFFASLDANADGQVDQQEAASFIESTIGGSDFATRIEQSHAAETVLAALDSNDTGDTVSVAELDVHLHKVLSVRPSLPTSTLQLSLGCGKT